MPALEGAPEPRDALAVDGRVVPGILWSPADADEHTPLVLAGHGGGFGTDGHKRVDSIVRLAAHLGSAHGTATVAIDQPGCGEREGAQQEQARRRAMSVEEAIPGICSYDPKIVGNTGIEVKLRKRFWAREGEHHGRTCRSDQSENERTTHPASLPTAGSVRRSRESIRREANAIAQRRESEKEQE